MKPTHKKAVCLAIAILGIFLSGMGIGLVYGVDHPRPNDKRTPEAQAARRSMGTTLTWTGLAVTFGSLGLLMMARNSEKKA
ncbi:hypothetical protein D0N36_14485 [Hymenobacter lapidiphilus]|nr:hypothetical protein D0N36_14485 [Hymenobacter sp. CCM 8763]